MKIKNENLYLIILKIWVTCLITADISLAQWYSDPFTNKAICKAYNNQSQPAIVSDGASGSIIAWFDDRSGGYRFHIYAQKLNADGVLQWTYNGAAICTYSSTKSFLNIISDGAGGGIVCWRDRRNGNDDIYAQRFDTNGIVQWTSNGVVVCNASNEQNNPMIISDDAGGAFIAWYDRRGSDSDIYAQRLSSDGTAQWTANGIAVCSAKNNQWWASDSKRTRSTMIPDGTGCAIITWKDYKNGNEDIYAQRLNADGTMLWTSDGVSVCTDTGDQSSPVLCTDGSGGAIISWNDYRSGDNYDIYAQRIDNSGNTLWTAEGVALCTLPSHQVVSHIVSDGASGAIAAWYDGRSDANWDIFAQRINSAGTVQWTTNGVAICDVTGSQSLNDMVQDNTGGALITWSDARGGIYSQKINGSGTSLWADDGVGVCLAGSSQTDPVLIPDGSGGAVFTWTDYRAGSSSADIYAQRVDSNGNLVGNMPVFSELGEWLGLDDTGQGRGVAWGDYDGNGDEDIYLTNYTSAPNRLYRNNGDGTFSEVGSAAGVASQGYSVAWSDYDNDSDLDLYVGVVGSNRLYRNNGDGTFADVASTTGVADNGNSLGCSWSDYDRDGDLDLYVVNDNSDNKMYRNNGDGTFTDVASAAGIDHSGSGYSAAWGDYDNDGDTDLFLATGGTDLLYRNNGDGTFTDVISTSGIRLNSYSQGLAWGDCNNDSYLDLFVSSRWGSNRYYRNNGDGTFSESGYFSGGGMGVSMGDYDNDGDLDLFIAIDGNNNYEGNKLYRNDGTANFTEVGESAGLKERIYAYGAAWGDYDGDGDLDLYVTNSGAANRFYRNNEEGNHWLVVKTVGMVSNKSGIGARIIVRSGSLRQMREVDGGSVLHSQPSLPVEFGLASATSIDSVIVQWPSGIVQTLTGVAVDQVLTVTEESPDDLTIEAGLNNPSSSSELNNKQDLAMLQLMLTAGGMIVNVSSMTFTGSGTGDESTDITGAELYLDVNKDGVLGAGDTQIGSTQTYSSDNGTITFSGLSETIDVRTREYWLLVYDMAGSASNGETFIASFNAAGDITASNGGSITPVGLFPITGATKTMVANGTLTIATDAFNPDASYEQNDTQDLEMLQINLTANVTENINISSIIFTGSGTAHEVEDITDVELYEDVNDNGEFDSGTDRQIGNSQTFSGDNGTVTFSGLSETITAGGSENWLLVYDLSGTSAGAGETFVASLNTSTDVTATGGTSTNPINPSGSYPISGGIKTIYHFTEIGSSAGVSAGWGYWMGVVWGDYDGDGDEDLYLTSYRNYDSRLYRNNGDGTFTEVGSTAGVNTRGYGAAWGDYDNDGDLDLYATTTSSNRLYMNNGDGTFTDVASTAGVAGTANTRGVSWVDYNRDGYLDIYVVNYNSANNLYRNNGNGTFTDMASSAGVAHSGTGYGSAWADYDNDDDPDLFLVTGGSTDLLYRNNGDGTFTDVASAAGVSSNYTSQGVAWGDCDNDGDLDLFVTRRWYSNKYYHNNGNGTFTNTGSFSYSGMGVCMADYDNDGDLDIFIPIDGDQNYDGNKLYLNDGSGNFTEVGESAGIKERTRSYGAGLVDYDGDGDLDFYTTNIVSSNRFYENSVEGTHWLAVRLIGVVNNKSGIGARVISKAGGLRQIREVDGGSGLYSQSSISLEFGLGSITNIDSVIVQWPDGYEQFMTDVSVDQILTITENRFLDSEAATLGSPILFNEGSGDSGNARTVEMVFNSLNGSGNISVQQVTEAPTNVPGLNICGYRWEITNEAGINSFSTDIIFHYTDTDATGYTESNAFFGIAKFNSSTNTWQWLGGTVDSANNTVTVSGVTSFSAFALYRRIFGDITGDGYVDAADLQRLGDCWHSTNSGEFNGGSDARFFNFNKNTESGNQIIDAADLQVFGDCWHNGVQPGSFK